MGEHLDFDKTARRTFDALSDYGFMNLLHLVQVELPRKDDYVGIGRIEPESLYVGDAELGGDMYFEPQRAGVALWRPCPKLSRL